MGFWDGSGIIWMHDHMQTICTSLQPHQHLIAEFLQAGCSSWRPTNCAVVNANMLLSCTVSDKSVSSYLRTLTTWHCPHLLAAAAAIDQRLLPAGPTAANLQQQRPDRTDRRTPDSCINLAPHAMRAVPTRIQLTLTIAVSLASFDAQLRFVILMTDTWRVNAAFLA